jgi:hypothetical protein
LLIPTQNTLSHLQLLRLHASSRKKGTILELRNYSRVPMQQWLRTLLFNILTS